MNCSRKKSHVFHIKALLDSNRDSAIINLSIIIDIIISIIIIIIIIIKK